MNVADFFVYTAKNLFTVRYVVWQIYDHMLVLQNMCDWSYSSLRCFKKTFTPWFVTQFLFFLLAHREWIKRTKSTG